MTVDTVIIMIHGHPASLLACSIRRCGGGGGGGGGGGQRARASVTHFQERNIDQCNDDGMYVYGHTDSHVRTRGKFGCMTCGDQNIAVMYINIKMHHTVQRRR